MKRALAIVLFATAFHAAAAVPTPSDFLKLKVGQDRVLADYRQIVSYFQELEKDSPRVRIETLGKTTLGEPMIMAVISFVGDMKNLQRIKEGRRKLSRPRGL